MDKAEFNKLLKEMMDDPNNQEILKKLGSDYDENGIAYWDKSGGRKEDNDK
jgi:hypothetical protein